jgi:predicted glutamine amidotransferase
MCLIAIKPRGVALPKDEHLRQGEKKNSDGMGIAIWKVGGKEVHIKKDFLKIEELLDYMKENVAVEDVCVIHFRFATHGLKDIGNRHPFPITRNGELLRKPEISCQFAAAHNGVIREYGIHQTYSDTQKFIMDILADDTIKNNLQNPTVRKLILNFIDGDRLAILDKDGQLFTFGDFEEEGGILFSNTGYKNWNITPVWRGNGYDWDEYHTYQQNLTNKATTISKKDNGFMFTCDCCKTKKWCQSVDGVGEYGAALYLCKTCRKKMKKGKIKTVINTIDSNIDKDIDDIEGPKTELQCTACLEWHSETDIVEREECRLCPKCLNDYNNINSGLI